LGRKEDSDSYELRPLLNPRSVLLLGGSKKGIIGVQLMRYSLSVTSVLNGILGVLTRFRVRFGLLCIYAIALFADVRTLGFFCTDRL
jgi:hypothetical protein